MGNFLVIFAVVGSVVWWALARRGGVAVDVVPPPAPGTAGPGPSFLPTPYVMRTGGRYRMRLQEKLLGTTLEGLGFSNVVRYALGNTPLDWPAVTLDVSDPLTSFAEGTWAGSSGSIGAPHGLWQIWPTRAA